MPRFSINQLTTYRWTFDEDLYYARRTGFDSVGVWRRKLADFGECRAIELLEEEQLAVSCLSWSGGFTGADGRTQEESVRDAIDALRQGARIGAECLIVYAGGRNNHIDRQLCRLLHQALDRLLVAAEMADVVLALKPMNFHCAHEWSFQTDLERAIELVASYNSPFLKLAYDNYQFPYLHRQRELVERLLPHLAIVQLGDAHQPHSIDQLRCPLGQGRLEVEDTIKALVDAGYSGTFDVELMGDEIESHDYEPLLQQLHQFLARNIPREGISEGASSPVPSATPRVG